MISNQELIEAMGLAIADVDGFAEEYRLGLPEVQGLYNRMATAALSAVEARASLVLKEIEKTPPSRGKRITRERGARKNDATARSVGDSPETGL
jgi:hypothetical protein